MFFHQAGQRCPVLVKMRLLDPFGFDRVAAQQSFDIASHPLIDEFEQACRRRIKAVIQVEDPVGNMTE